MLALFTFQVETGLLGKFKDFPRAFECQFRRTQGPGHELVPLLQGQLAGTFSRQADGQIVDLLIDAKPLDRRKSSRCPFVAGLQRAFSDGLRLEGTLEQKGIE